MESANLFSVAGVAYDIAGAILLAQAIVFSRDKLIAAQSGTYFGGNSALFAALEEQRHDGRFGLGLLVIGFFFQLLAALNFVWSANDWPAAVAIALAWLACYGIGARQLKTTRTKRFKAHLARMEQEGRAASQKAERK